MSLAPQISIEKPVFYDAFIDNITENFHLTQGRPDIHMSDLIYCVRKAFYDKCNFIRPTGKTLKYFIRGIALQDAMMKKEPDSQEKDGIVFSPDYWDGTELAELKTTTMGRKRMDDFDFPDGWILQIASYCFALGLTHAYLMVFCINDHSDDLILFYRLDFTKEELEENWNRLIVNKNILQEAMDKGEAPPCYPDWQCASCRYSLRCKYEEN